MRYSTFFQQVKNLFFLKFIVHKATKDFQRIKGHLTFKIVRYHAGIMDNDNKSANYINWVGWGLDTRI